MARIIIELQDTPEGVMVSAFGAVLPKSEKDMTDAQKLAVAIKEACEEKLGGVPNVMH